MKPVRVSAKAIIIENGKILLIKHSNECDEWFGLPGGGQENGETLEDALIRECLEEINAKIIVKDVLFVRDYIAKNHEFSDTEDGTHQIEIMFECLFSENQTPCMGSNPDSTQKDVLWIEIKELSNNRLYPKELVPFLRKNLKNKIYLGDVN